MPQNFTKTLETVSPSIQMTRKVYDTSIGEAAQTVGETLGKFLEDYAKQKKEEKDLADTSSFYGELNQASLNIEELRDRNLDARNQLVQEYTDKLNDDDTKNDEGARRKFYREMELLNLREQQQGIVLDSAKRAVVRKWMTNRPDMADVWSQALTVDQKLMEARSESANYASQALTEYDALARRALAFGTTIPQQALTERLAQSAQRSQNDLSIKRDQGTLGAAEVNDSIITALEVELLNVTNIAFRNMQQAWAGNPQALANTRQELLGVRARLQSEVTKAKIEARKQGMLVDTKEAEDYINKYMDGLEGLLTESNLQSATAANQVIQDEKLYALLHSYFPYIHPLIIRQKGLQLWQDAYQGVEKFYNKVKAPQGLANLAEAEALGDESARQAMSWLRISRDTLKKGFEGSRFMQDDGMVLAMNALFTALETGQPVPVAIAEQAHPLLMEILFSIKPGSLPDSVPPSNLTKSQIETIVSGYTSKVWRSNHPIFDPSSPQARQMQILSDAEWGKYIQPAANELLKKVNDVPQADKEAIVFSSENGFTQDDSAIRRIRGRYILTNSMKEALEELNLYYTMVSATRPLGKQAADAWANRFVQNNLRVVPQEQQQQQPQQPQPSQDGADEADFYALPR